MALLLAHSLTSIAARAQPVAESGEFSRAHAIGVDGRLTEAAWHSARPITRFFETYPGNVVAPPVRTEARFLYDDTYVYIGVTAYEPEPSTIRSGFVRRDTVTADQDYIQVLVDPLNTQRTALVFTTNAQGVRNDGQFSEDEPIIDTRPDLDFDVATSINEADWQAEFRIPLATLRYRAGASQAWNIMILRNRPRLNRTTIQSGPEPRQATCKLCFAGQMTGISIADSHPPLYVTPHLTYARTDAFDEIRTGLDMKWLARSDTSVDATLRPDFSQVEADDLQLTANSQFALALKEKRPFFLEGADLLSTPILAIYTRSLSAPQAGVRITQRADAYDYAALVMRDQRGGLLVEPGPLTSTAIAQPFDANVGLARYKRQVRDFTWGVLASARQHGGAGGGDNLVYGIDGTWAPTYSDRVSVQALGSVTTNPDRPELTPAWDGRHFDGVAYSATWQHASDRWYATVLDSQYSEGFRAWNGFVPQVDVATYGTSAGLFFYPSSTWCSSMSPGFTYTGVRQLGGGQLTDDLAATLSLTLPYSTEITVSWSPNATYTSPTQAQTYDYWSVMLRTTPAAWMPGVTMISTFGDGIDFSTGDLNKSISVLATVPLRFFGRLELVGDLGYIAQTSRNDGRRIFAQHNSQLAALWHFSSKLYVQAMYQSSRFSSQPSGDGSRPRVASSGNSFSALFSYQSNWQTRFFVGLRSAALDDSSSTAGDLEVFAKFSYVLSAWK